ncbi:hypothetical protein ACFV3R_17895 [Streptomyces sp. NPDC059740]|uniref:hypothetical protein n=1 Tax=Streptomyces sp. NPDC059740 TaxID=3346926 RepID=UPI003667672A
MALEDAQRPKTGWQQSERKGRVRELRTIEVWESCTPVRLAGYEDDPAEPHIVRGID